MLVLSVLLVFTALVAMVAIMQLLYERAGTARRVAEFRERLVGLKQTLAYFQAESRPLSDERAVACKSRAGGSLVLEAEWTHLLQRLIFINEPNSLLDVLLADQHWQMEVGNCLRFCGTDHVMQLRLEFDSDGQTIVAGRWFDERGVRRYPFIAAKDVVVFFEHEAVEVR